MDEDQPPGGIDDVAFGCVIAEAAMALDDAAPGAVAGVATAAEAARPAPARAGLPAAAGCHPGGLAVTPAGGHAVAPEDNASILPDGPGDQNSGSDGLAMAAAGLDMASGASPFRRIEPWPRCQPAMATYRGSRANV